MPEHTMAALEELGFVRTADEAPAQQAPPRWQRLGRAAFSPAAWVCYASLVLWATALMVRSPSLVPRSHDLIFSSHYSVVNLTLLVAVTPLIALHEIYHARAVRVCLGVAFATFTRLLWQFFFYPRTDIFVLITTMLGCVDLHTVALRTLRNRLNRLNRLIGRRRKVVDLADAHPVDRKAARSYSWLVPAGYAISLSTTLFALLPLWIAVRDRARRRRTGLSHLTA